MLVLILMVIIFLSTI